MKKQIQRIGMLCLMLLTALWANAATTAKWDFKNDIPSGIQANTNYQGVEADVEADVAGIFMHVDATSGKLYCVNRDNAQMNPGTVLKVPVTDTKDVVTVVGFPNYCHFAVGGEENGSETTVAHTATAAEVSQGFVEVTATEGNNYIYSVSVVLNNEKALAADVTANWDFQNNIPAGIQANTNYQGVEADVESDVAGIFMHVDATSGKLYCVNRDNAQMNPGTILQVPVISKEDVVTVVGFPNYCHFAVGGEENGSETTVAHTATSAEVSQGYVEVTATAGNNYIYKVSVVQKPSKAPVSLKDVAATATFPFNLGTEGQTAEFGDAGNYFLSSKVTVGEGLFIKDVNNGAGFDQTRIEPYSQNNNPDETNAIRFIIQPKYGLTFTPTKVSLKTTRFGTDNGLLDIAWENPDSTKVTLATEVKPNRNNGTNPAIASEEGQKFSNLSYEVTGSTPAEGPVALLVNLYHLQSGKQVGFADIVIEGLLNGEEVSVPILASFTANGVNYEADKIFEADGDQYVATIELSKKEDMISASNPVSNVTAASGEIGEITYAGDATQCAVTIPVSLAGITINYVANFVQKPDFTLTYINTDGTTMGTQAVEKDAPIGEFAVDYTTAIAEEGYKVRGWFVKKSGTRKYTTDEIVTSDLNIYAVATEIEGPSTYKKYNFDLADKYFYPEDHEAFVSVGSGYWHDNQHGWAFKNGDRIELLVGPKAVISVTNCLYSAGDAQLVFKNAAGEEVGRIAGKGEADGQIESFNYEGQEGKLYIDIEAGGAVYIHNIRIVNTSETNYDLAGNWYFVKPGNASSLIDVIDVVNGTNGNKDAERSYIFLPDGTYDLGETVLTAISGHNISIIGQSREGTIIKNAPDKSIEGIGTTATLLNSGQNLYMQDLTLQNALDYYGAQAGGQVGGRAVCLQDKGDRVILKNVAMLSYQDTYYSQNTKQSYWEDCDVHGTVDFLCGGGDVRFVNTTLSLEPRNPNGSGARTITAATTTSDFGYVFDNCKVVDLANGKGEWNFGRTWQNYPIVVYLNTTLDNNAAKTLIDSRWIQKGMNNRDPKVFGEYGTMDEAGNNITPASNIINSYGGAFETILTAAQAEAYTYDKMFKENQNAWDPASLTVQVEAPEASYANGELTWKAQEGAIAYAIFKNGVFAGLVESETSFAIEAEAGDVLTVRAANSMGGFGKAATAEVTGVSVNDYDTEAPAAGEYEEIGTDRVLLDGLNTIVLPFATTKEELQAEKVLQYTGSEVREGTVYLKFQSVETLEANTPYAVFVDGDKTLEPFKNKTVVEANDLTVSDNEYSFVGTYTAYEAGKSPIVEGDLIAGVEEFVKANGGNKIRAYRAYMKKVGDSEASVAFIIDDTVVDGIEAVQMLEEMTGDIYNLNGQKVDRAQRGIYIINGKKVLVK